MTADEKSGTDAVREVKLSRARREAVVLLSEGNRRIPLLWAGLSITLFLIVILFSFAYAENAIMSLLTFCGVPEVLLGLFTWLVGMVMIAVGVFLAAPLCCGIVSFAVGVTEDRVDTARLFLPFTSLSEYGRALSRIWEFFWRVAVTVVAVAALSSGLLSAFPEGEPVPVWAGILLCFIGAVVALIFLLLFGGQFLAPYYFAVHPEWSPRTCRRRSRAVCSQYRLPVFGFHLTFLGLALLSLLTVGIYLFAHILPLWLLSYVRAARMLNDASGDPDLIDTTDITD